MNHEFASVNVLVLSLWSSLWYDEWSVANTFSYSLILWMQKKGGGEGGDCWWQTAACKLRMICSCSYFYIFIFRSNVPLVGLWEWWGNASYTKFWIWRWTLFCSIPFHFYRLVHYGFQHGIWEPNGDLSTGGLFSPLQLTGRGTACSIGSCVQHR